jgi:hypothetical protein
VLIHRIHRINKERKKEAKKERKRYDYYFLSQRTKTPPRTTVILFGSVSLIPYTISHETAGKAINLQAFTNRHLGDRGRIWAGNEGDQVGCKLKIPQCPWGILSLSSRA